MTVMMLFELCQKQGKQVDIKYWKNGEKNVATVYVDGKFIASGSSEKKETAKLNAAKQALLKLSESMPTNVLPQAIVYDLEFHKDGMECFEELDYWVHNDWNQEY